MFNKKLKQQKEQLENERDNLKDDLSTVKVELREIRAKKKIEEEIIKKPVQSDVDLKVVGKIDLESMNQKTRPATIYMYSKL